MISVLATLLSFHLSRADFDGKSFQGTLDHIIDGFPCVTLFTNEGSIGCRTVNDHSLGALYEIQHERDLHSIGDITVDFSVFTPAKYFDENLFEILSRHKPQGVIVYDDDWKPSGEGNYSPDMNCTQGIGTPQSDYTINKRYPWNDYGNGLIYKSLS
jgi:hypothetical protein